MCASNLTEEEKSAQLRSKSINAQLRKDGKNPSVKLLLLGTGEMGHTEETGLARASFGLEICQEMKAKLENLL